ncbi:Innexin unc 7 [Echinococcus multilocularis]|uniref:Innexin n=1 Tax=Echinococcus multilocularis TaxID=6211 RepID=A0A068Y6C7_ECHMU|nr:Innexin unc 7 [Echinococcus multilocularis]
MRASRLSQRRESRTDSMVILEDFGDQLNRIYTPLLILLLAAAAMTNVYFLPQISCNIPTLPADDFRGFAESVCWSRGAIGVDKDEEMPGDEVEWEKLQGRRAVSFHQWVPFCLSIQAILFYLPHLIWKVLCTSSFGDSLNYLVTRAKAAGRCEEQAVRAKFVRACADHLYLLSRQHFSTSTSIWSRVQDSLCSRQPCRSCCFVKRRIGNHLVIYYLLMKALYIANCIGQIFAIVCFLGPNNTYRSSLGGFTERLLSFAASYGEWGGSQFLPHQALCPVRVPHLGVRSQTYTAICALTMNVLNEKIYLFLWMWILAVLAVTAITTAAWMWRLLVRAHSNSYLRAFLYTSLLAPPPFRSSDTMEVVEVGGGVYQTASLDGTLVERFLTEVVGNDGDLMIRMLRCNAGDIVTGEVFVTWWWVFKAMEGGQDEDDFSGYAATPPRTYVEMQESNLVNRIVRRTMSYI